MTERTAATCPRCSQGFTIKRPHQLYCSSRCRKAAWTAKQGKLNGTCPQCRKKFQKVTLHHTYCSNQCKMSAWWQRKVDQALILRGDIEAPGPLYAEKHRRTIDQRKERK